MATSVKNLTIENGTIANMVFGGVACVQCEHILIKDIHVDGLSFQETAIFAVPVGISVTSSKKAVVDNCTVQNINVKAAATSAIQMTQTIDSKILNCTVRNLLNLDGACSGIGHLLCQNAKVKSCTVDTLETQFIDNINTVGHTAIGIIPVESKNLEISDCSMKNITGCCDDAHGMSLFLCSNAVVKKCTVENVLDGAGAAQTGAKATGIEVYASHVKVMDCSVKNIKAINPQDLQAAGFSVALGSKVKFLRCKAEKVNVVDQNGNQSSTLGYGTGFGWAPDPRSQFIGPAAAILYKDCTAKHCQVGFDSFNHIGATWKDIHSICNGISILDESHSQRTISCNACSECGCTAQGCTPAPLSVTINNVAKHNKFINVKARYCKDVKLISKPAVIGVR